MKDFRDKNCDIITMFRGTDVFHKFHYTNEDGSPLEWQQYDVVCEARLAFSSENPNFTFPVSQTWFDGELYEVITIPKELVDNHVRENKIYYKVFAHHKTTGSTMVINSGEVWLK